MWSVSMSTLHTLHSALHTPHSALRTRQPLHVLPVTHRPSLFSLPPRIFVHVLTHCYVVLLLCVCVYSGYRLRKE